MNEVIYLENEGYLPGAWKSSPGDHTEAYYFLSQEEVEILSGAIIVDKLGERVYRVLQEGFPPDYVRVRFSKGGKMGNLVPLFDKVEYLSNSEVEILLFNAVRPDY